MVSNLGTRTHFCTRAHTYTNVHGENHFFFCNVFLLLESLCCSNVYFVGMIADLHLLRLWFNSKIYCVCLCVCVSTCVCTFVCVFCCVCAWVHLCVCVCVCTSVNVCVCVRMCMQGDESGALMGTCVCVCVYVVCVYVSARCWIRSAYG